MTPFFRGLLIYLLFWALWFGICLYAMSAPSPTTLTFRSPSGELFVLHPTQPCFREDIHQARLAHWHLGAESVRGCYIESDGHVFIVFEDGDRAMIPSDKFTSSQ